MIATALSLSFLVPIGTAFAGTTYWPSPWNGIKVYLSPAKHSPDNTGCDSFSENTEARDNALKAKDWLYSYNYAVRVGDGDYTQNTSDSNNWGSDVHIPIHSNAGTWDCTSPYDYSNGGTWTMYASTNGRKLATKILYRMDGESPGTNDRVGTDVELSGKHLYELRYTNAVAAYVEAAFHTFGPDEDWLRLNSTVGTLVARGIDDYFGNPRCGVSVTCIQSIGDPVARSVGATAKVADAAPRGRLATTSPRNELGSAPDLDEALEELLVREFGLSPSMLQTAELAGDGTAVVDFSAVLPEVIPNASTSAGSASLLGSLNATVFQFPEVERVIYSLDGDCEAFWGWLQSACDPVERQDWEGRK
ncbi:MAG: hypothetical protein KatS3mg011_0533 [Acidimicrobiia bacterium]|nr:MAG: hypothetical protein KatS3mg011_0533 [Acidimicrobiia bacterium]